MTPVRILDVHTKEIRGDSKERIRDVEIDVRRPSLSQIINSSPQVLDRVEAGVNDVRRVMRGVVREKGRLNIDTKPSALKKPGRGAGIV